MTQKERIDQLERAVMYLSLQLAVRDERPNRDLYASPRGVRTYLFLAQDALGMKREPGQPAKKMPGRK